MLRIYISLVVIPMEFYDQSCNWLVSFLVISFLAAPCSSSALLGGSADVAAGNASATGGADMDFSSAAGTCKSNYCSQLPPNVFEVHAWL